MMLSRARKRVILIDGDMRSPSVHHLGGLPLEPGLSNFLAGSDDIDALISPVPELGIEVIEKRITRDEVYCADEAFFTGTAAEVTPIRELDNRQIGPGHRGPVTKALQEKYFDVVYGRSAAHADWLAYV